MKRLFLLLLLLLCVTPAWASNDLTGNPLVLDTTGATAITANQYRIHTIIWNCGLSCAANDVLLLKNAAGATILSLTAAAVNQFFVVPFSSSFQVNGLILTTITHGTLYIYYDR